MSDVRAAVIEAVWDVIAVVATPGTLLTLLVVAVFFFGAYLLSLHRYIAAAMRVAGLLAALMALVLAVRSGGWVTTLDTATTSWFLAHRSVTFDVAATVVTDVGSPVATGAAAVICAGLLSWWARSRVAGLIVVGTVCAAALASTALKLVVDRPRPPLQWQLVLETDPSFPSGHVTGTAALLGIIAVCFGTGRSPIARAWLAGAVVTGVLVVAATRLYLGVHWLSDTAAGAVLAAVFVIIGASVLHALGTRSGRDRAPAPVAAAAPASPTRLGLAHENPVNARDVRARDREPRKP
jgi:membrane-associated phospholipid phosphatase